MKQKYNPMNKEFQDKAKELGLNGYQYYRKLVEEGKLPDPTEIDRGKLQKWAENKGYKDSKEYYRKRREELAKMRGFKNFAHLNREYKHEKGISLSIEDSENRFAYISQNYIMKTFEEPIEMPFNNPGYDWLCKKGEKIDHKGCNLYYGKGSPFWLFHIRYNNIADWFILSAWDDQESLNPMHIWAFHKNDMIRRGNSYTQKTKFWMRDSFVITNTPRYLKEFEKKEVTDRLDKLKELCDTIRR